MDITYEIEKRNGEDYIVTNQTYKNKVITVKLDSIIKSANVVIQSMLTSNQEIFWIFKKDGHEDKFCIELLIESDSYRASIDINLFLESIISCIQNNTMLESCAYINDKMNNLYQFAFEQYLLKGKTIYSEIPLTGYCVVETIEDDKEVGYSSRFIFNSNSISLLEYTGKQINDDKYRIKINKNEKVSIFNVTKINREESIYESNYKIGYYTFENLNHDFYLNLEPAEKKEYNKLNVSSSNSIKGMFDYLIKANTSDELMKYRISMKPQLKLIDINNFMVREFCK